MKNKYDNLMIQGLTTLKNIEFAYVYNLEEIDYNFSEKYIKNKERLIKKLGHSYWKYVNTVAKKAAVIIVALILAFSSLMTVDAFREKIVGFAYKVYTTFTEILKDNSAKTDQISKFYEPSYIHNLYSVESSTYSPSFASTFWSNGKNQTITFTQSNLSNHNQKSQ